MATYAQQIIDDFRTIYKDCPVTRAWKLLNQVDILVTRTFRHRQKTIYLALTSGQDVALPANALWVRRLRYVPNTDGGYWLGATSEDALEVEGSPIDADDDEAPPLHAYQTHDMTGGRLAFDPIPNASSLVVTDATNASPIVITTSAVHELSDGDPVSIRAVEGNEAANVDGYALVTGYSTTTFALYSDADLTTTVDGDGDYTKKGLVGTSAHPFVEAEVAWHTQLVPASGDQGSVSSLMPDVPFYNDMYVDGMCFFWAKRRHRQDVPMYKELFEDAINRQDELTNKRIGHQFRTISPFLRRRSGYCRR